MNEVLNSGRQQSVVQIVGDKCLRLVLVWVVVERRMWGEEVGKGRVVGREGKVEKVEKVERVERVERLGRLSSPAKRKGSEKERKIREQKKSEGFIISSVYT